MITLKTKFHRAQSDDWKNDVAAELNVLLTGATEKTATAVLSIVARVAEFEGIETARKKASTKSQQTQTKCCREWTCRTARRVTSARL